MSARIVPLPTPETADRAGPRHDAVVRLRRSVPHVSWFAAVGEPQTQADTDEAGRYLAGLGFAGLGVVAVAGWEDAKRIADDPAWDRRWWDAEETLRADLLGKAREQLGEGALVRLLSAASDTASDTVQGAAAIAAARAGVADPALIKSAAGAATQCCYQAALALAAAAGPDHPFAVKFRLFEAGRWPLGIVGDRFHLF